MKLVLRIINCAGEYIKKNFFKSSKDDISHACEKLKNMSNNGASEDEVKLNEEYTLNYIVTTRWQTI